MTATTATRRHTPTLLSVKLTWERLATQSGPDRYPFLDGCPLLDIHERFNDSRKGDRVADAWKSRVIYGLLEASVAGDELAQHTLVRLFIPKASLLSRSCTALRGMSLDDADAIVVSALWEASRTYPLHRISNPGSNFYLNALAIITAGANSDREMNADDEYLEWKANQVNDELRSPDSDLAEVLAWALESKILSRDEIRLLTWYYLADHNSADHGERVESMAAELGVRPNSIQQRVCRIRKRLIDAVGEHIRLYGRW